VERYIRLVLRFRFLILAAMAVITVASGYVISTGVVASSMGDFLGERG
jgi:hypothetical protein